MFSSFCFVWLFALRQFVNIAKFMPQLSTCSRVNVQIVVVAVNVLWEFYTYTYWHLLLWCWGVYFKIFLYRFFLNNKLPVFLFEASKKICAKFKFWKTPWGFLRKTLIKQLNLGFLISVDSALIMRGIAIFRDPCLAIFTTFLLPKMFLWPGNQIKCFGNFT